MNGVDSWSNLNRRPVPPVSTPELLRDFGWRRRSTWAVLGLRPHRAQHTKAEAGLLRRYATGARSIVELGVSEGGSARMFANVMAPGGSLYLVDPYPPGRLFGINMAQIVARRAVRPRSGAHIHWIRKFSFEAASEWKISIDFLFIDANHGYEEVKRDWDDWNRFILPGGCVAFHDARLFEGGWTTPEWGPVRLVPSIEKTVTWQLLDSADSTVVFRRTVSGAESK